ncbi:fungal-specific transcription factor domain-containing protein [Lentinula edodes]|uniref:Fungal-specific transcription factor domain-containing protein n=1 Tax=Lentinula lateritia TaxID=40482 RepID=A0A9W9DFH5_9AGAR|nr:fungal-specific transcription factor domain-containing protein [Lentinula edodes]
MPNKRRGPKVGSSRRSSTFKTELKHVVSSIIDSADTYTLPKDLNFVRTLVIDLASHIRSLETQLKQAFNSTPRSSSFSPPTNHECGVLGISTADMNTGDIDVLSSCFEEILTLDDQRYYGNSSTFQFIWNALHIKGQISGGEIQPSIKVNKLKRPELWTVPKRPASLAFEHPPYVFPDDDLMHDLVDLYFAKVDPYFPMLHRTTLERSLSDSLHLTDRRVGAVLLMICSLASQHSDDPRTLDEGTKSEYFKGWKYFRQIQLTHQFEEPPSIHEFQLYPLASLYLHTTNISGVAFYLIAIGIRSAHQKGVNERQFVVPNNAIETELWRRAFWGLVVFDIYGSTTLGRPRATIAENIDADYPQEFDDDREKDTGISSEPVTKPSSSSFWVHYIKLFEIIGFANRAFYSVKASELWDRLGISGSEWDHKAVIELDAALNKWVDAIPNHLRWDPQDQSEACLRQSSMLYATYYWAQFQVHKPFISRSDTPSTFPSVTICANSARTMIGLLETQHRQHPFVALPLLIGPLFDSAIVLLINLWRGLRNLIALDPSKELEYVRRCINILSMYEKRYQAAGRLCDLLNSVISMELPTFPERRPPRTMVDVTPVLDDSDFERYLSRNGAGSPPVPSSSGDRTVLNSDSVARLESSDVPCHSYELGTLPLHSSWDPDAHGSTSVDAVYPDNNPFGGGSSSVEPSQQEDWELFIAGIDMLLQTGFGSNSSL